jgi:hypothetical protein
MLCRGIIATTMKKIATTTLMLLGPLCTHAQIYATPGGAPTLMNPAFTGMHNGSLRINVIGSPNLFSDNMNHKMVTTSADYRTKSWSKGRQFAGIGAAYTYEHWAVDGNRNSNNTAKLSAAWHLLGVSKNRRHLSVSLQSGWNFSEEDYTVYYLLSTGHLSVAQRTRTRTIYQANAGIAYAQQIGKKLRYVVGANTLIGRFAADALTLHQTYEFPLPSYHSLLAGAEVDITPRWSLRPSLQYMFYAQQSETFAGCEVRYKPRQTAFFIGLWQTYRQTMAVTAGANHNRWRATICTQHTNNPISTITPGNLLELSLQYTIWGSGRTALPCVRY